VIRSLIPGTSASAVGCDEKIKFKKIFKKIWKKSKVDYLCNPNNNGAAEVAKRIEKMFDCSVTEIGSHTSATGHVSDQKFFERMETTARFKLVIV